MKITIIGSGYVGLVTGTCLAELGNDVLCLDLDATKIEMLNAGEVPIYEPGLKELIARNHAAGRLRFTSDIETSVSFGDIQFIAVGTPPDEDGSADLRYVLSAARNIGRYMTTPKVVVDKSTVPVGTGARVRECIAAQLQERGLPALDFAVVSNPEFLKEGAAIEDFMRPDRIVIGTESGVSGQKARETMRSLYAPFTRNHDRILNMDIASAEFTKYAANAMLATRISFMNELANLADVVGADIELVRQGIGSDPRIGYGFLYAGTGYGGSCFPKDVQALKRTADEYGQTPRILTAVEAVNHDQKHILVRKIVAHYGEDLAGLTFALWGLAFKPNTDDMRAAPSRVVIKELLARGARVQAFDPVAMEEAKRAIHADLASDGSAAARILFVSDQAAALQNADGLVVVTEWKSFRSPNFAAIAAALRQPVIFDGRNLYEPAELSQQGFAYYGIGRKAVSVVPNAESRRDAAAVIGNYRQA
ncbi:UDP-glucose/GDP-mannose dehydrogenase family protein [Cupriavidus necator]|uniref:UDP-glucose 6-dehydrogenase n=1 Tax=Cupriavidus necator TaxID=106590 RepID=A0A367PPK5_CUPNE|nr:UDP-glucose/GDP-mannose dehydrogenase family protein [Cupriavidus necator]QQX88673.1 UDP-glucose/GDP-mannose dehydrogenase family protein [Cupriavidus necator]RCJ09831.1 UDP-glucose/GDP-mannose dehydrogenase family protein [Cupriavidus necator]